MKKIIGMVFGLSLSTLVAALPAAAEGKQNFTLKNRTGYTISEVYVSPSKAETWEEDVLGRDELDDGQTVEIDFHRSEKACKWDLKVVYDDGESAEWDSFNLCEVSTISIFYDRKKDTTWAEYE